MNLVRPVLQRFCDRVRAFPSLTPIRARNASTLATLRDSTLRCLHGVLLIALLLLPSLHAPHAETACKISVDACPADARQVGVTLEIGTSQGVCASRAQEVYDQCDLASFPAPANTYPRRVKAEFIGPTSTDPTPDQTIEVTYYPALPPAELPVEGRSIVGAIRFDAWYQGSDHDKDTLFYSDGAEQDWQARLPFYTTLDGQSVAVPYPTPVGSGTVISYSSDTQEAVDQEVRFASKGGLSYWAFVWNGRYEFADPTAPAPPPDPLGPDAHWKNHVELDRSLQLYLTSSARDRVRFALIIPVNRFGPPPPFATKQVTDQEFEEQLFDADPTSSWFETYLEQWVELASESDYQQVLGDRPLIFLFNVKSLETYFNGNDPDARARIAMHRIRARFREEGLGNPYIVGMFFAPWTHEGERYIADQWGLDALSTYAFPLGYQPDSAEDTILLDSQTGTYYSNPSYNPPAYLDPSFSLLTQSRDYRNQVQPDGKQVLPNVPTGWDFRPLLVPDLRDHTRPGNVLKARWSQHALPGEIATHLEEVVDWVEQNPGVTESNATLMYAWNELLEGGSLVPTFGDGTGRLDAIRGVVCRDPEFVGSCGMAPTGHIGFVGTGWVVGWAYDPDWPDRSIELHFYKGAPYSPNPEESGELIATQLADEPRSDLNESLGVTGDHGLLLKLPREHHGAQIYVHAVDPVRGSLNPLIPHFSDSFFVHPTECADGRDNNYDGLADANGVDLNGDEDFNDPGEFPPQSGGCVNAADRSEEPDCSDLLDNDGDGRADYAGVDLDSNGSFTDREHPPDPDCGKWGRGFEAAAGDCADRIDNDGDDLADGIGVDLNGDGDFGDVEYPPDAQCTGVNDSKETSQSTCGLGFELALLLPLLICLRAVRARLARTPR